MVWVTATAFQKRQALAITLLIWLISTLINVPYLLSYELVDGSYYVPKDRCAAIDFTLCVATIPTTFFLQYSVLWQIL